MLSKRNARMVMMNESPRVSSLFDGSVYEAFAGGIILLDGDGEGRCSGGFGGEVSGSGFAASVFDIWAMRDDGPPKMSPRIFTFCDSGAVRARHFISRLISYYESDNFCWRLRIKSLFWPLSLVSLGGKMYL